MASTMKICSECGRHLMAPEPQCPFCGAAMPMEVAPPVRRRCQGIMLGLSIALGSAGCSPETDDPPDPATTSESGDTSQTSTTAASTGTTMLPGSSTGASTGSDSTTAGESSSDDADDGGGGFYAGASPDLGEPFQCSIYVQDCPEGEKCTPWANGGGAWNATRCTPVDDDPDHVGEPCTAEGFGISGIDSCDVGAMCWDVDAATDEGECVALCVGSEAAPTCDDPDDVCVITNEGALALCLPSCDPVLQDCEDGDGCYPSPSTDNFMCAPVAAESVHGDECEFINVCSAGQVCLFGELDPDCPFAGCCAEVCSLDDVDADADCALLDPMQSCVAWYEEGTAPVGQEHVGVCTRRSS